MTDVIWLRRETEGGKLVVDARLACRARDGEDLTFCAISVDVLQRRERERENIVGEARRVCNEKHITAYISATRSILQHISPSSPPAQSINLSFTGVTALPVWCCL
jgi:hypothetical protein